MKREFQQPEAKKVVVSDLTYEKVKNKWHYICIFVDLFNREIIGFSTSSNKDANLGARAFSSIQGDLRDIQMFHTNRGRALSMNGCPYDNALMEATFKIIKTEFLKRRTFDSLEHLTLEFSDYVNWFNKLRIHETLGYMSPVEYKRFSLKEIV